MTYEAVQTRCPDVAEVTYGGPVGECGRCDADSDCAGYTRFLGGSFCQPLDETENYFCLQDCTEDPQACGPDRECDAAGNCIPTSGSCPPVKPCSLNAPQGACDTGETCINGDCVRAFCIFGQRSEPGSIQMIRRGKNLVAQYETSLSDWYRNTDESIDNQLAREYFRSEYELSSFTDLIETLIATYDIFGRIY